MARLIARAGRAALPALVAVALVAVPGAAQVAPPAGFNTAVYVTGAVSGVTVAGIPSVATLGFDRDGAL